MKNIILFIIIALFMNGCGNGISDRKEIEIVLKNGDTVTMICPVYDSKIVVIRYVECYIYEEGE